MNDFLEYSHTWFPQSQAALQWYRLINMMIGGWVWWLGKRYNSSALRLSGAALAVVDIALIVQPQLGENHDLLQLLRLMASTVLAPLWIIKGLQLARLDLIALGLLMLITDGFLFVRNL